jgi:protein tyrosine phosphatase (PTP) superfamily phosphohydrolase (DUF442 family)
MPVSLGKVAPILLLALALPGCRTTASASLDGTGGSPAERTTLGSMSNVSEVDGVWIGSRPSSSDLDLARRRGIGVAIDLSPTDDEPGYDVPAACATRNITYLRLEVKKSGSLPDETIDRVLAELRREDRGPLLIFCSDGSRAAMMFAIWRALDGRIGIDAAIVEARRSGMKPGVPESFVRLQVERRTQRSEARSETPSETPSEIIAPRDPHHA